MPTAILSLQSEHKPIRSGVRLIDQDEMATGHVGDRITTVRLERDIGIGFVGDSRGARPIVTIENGKSAYIELVKSDTALFTSIRWLMLEASAWSRYTRIPTTAAFTSAASIRVGSLTP